MKKSVSLPIALAAGCLLWVTLHPAPGSTTPVSPAGAGEPAALAAGTLKVPARAESNGSPQRESLVARLEFEQLGLRLVGMASFEGVGSCFIQQSGSPVHMIYNVGDVVGGFRVALIGDDSVTFERDAQRFCLALGESTGEPSGEFALAAAGLDKAAADAEPTDARIPMASLPADVSPGAPDEDLETKAARAGLKVRTQRYASATVIDDVTLARVGTRAPETRAQFIMPIDGRRTSGFGYRKHPIGGSRLYHRGLDIAAPYGTTVRAAAAGTVKKVSTSLTLGRYILIEHAGGYETAYAHLSRQLVSAGQKVGQGEAIGREGSTGLSTGPHLHFEIRKRGVAINPEAHVRVPR